MVQVRFVLDERVWLQKAMAERRLQYVGEEDGTQLDMLGSVSSKELTEIEMLLWELGERALRDRSEVTVGRPEMSSDLAVS